MLEELLERFRKGDRNALARLLSLVGRGERVADILAGLPQGTKSCRVVAVTGSAGVGKSSLVGKLIEHLRGAGASVAVLACDPQSPLSGGALLGDRFRMPNRPDDPGVYIRSLAAAADQGTVARHLPAMVRLLEAFGFENVLIETVGAGQGDTAVRNLADVVVLLLQPETGDDLQWEKAGLLEVADIVVIHKADLPGAEQVENQVRTILGLSGAETVPILRVSAWSGAGIAELWRAIADRPAKGPSAAGNGHDLLTRAQEELAVRWARNRDTHPEMKQLLADCQQGRLGTGPAVDRLLKLLAACDD